MTGRPPAHPIGLRQPSLLTVGQVFENAIYTVPVYQRNFAWRAPQIEQLIRDIEDARVDQKRGANTRSYFLGNLIVTQRNLASDEPEGPQRRGHYRAGSLAGAEAEPDFEVIDGQQRLTTLHLLLTYLNEKNAAPSRGHEDRLHYESRPRAAAALRVVAPGSRALATDAVDGGIHEAYDVIDQAFVGQRIDRHAFGEFLYNHVQVVRAVLPVTTDLNRYFEIMNTRGEQLQQVDIVKARLMSRLPDPVDRGCFAWIWDACSDLDSYVQMSLTPGDTEARSAVFGDDWSWLVAGSFEDLVETRVGMLAPRAPGPDEASSRGGESRTLAQAVELYAQVVRPDPTADTMSVRFRSTIEFPTLLLHVLKVWQKDDGADDRENDRRLDDKRLIDRFEEAFDPTVSRDIATDVRRFAVLLLRCRNLFDAYILKRDRSGTHRDEGEWSLKRLRRRRADPDETTAEERRTSGATYRAGYIDTFRPLSSLGRRIEAVAEEDAEAEEHTRDLVLIQSMLRVTYTGPSTMHWITRVLRRLDAAWPERVPGPELVAMLRDSVRATIRTAWFGAKGEPTGFEIPRIVFTYLDYLLLRQPRADQGARIDSDSTQLVIDPREYRFGFRNSIEHFFPQSPDATGNAARISARRLDSLGNLALVSARLNSRFGNSPPLAKANEYDAIVAQSPKLALMAAITQTQQTWSTPQIRSHHVAMAELLREDLDEVSNPSRRERSQPATDRRGSTNRRPRARRGTGARRYKRTR